MIKNLTIGDLTIDCANPERARDFYAGLMGYEKTKSLQGKNVNTDVLVRICNFLRVDISDICEVVLDDDGTGNETIEINIRAINEA